MPGWCWLPGWWAGEGESRGKPPLPGSLPGCSPSHQCSSLPQIITAVHTHPPCPVHLYASGIFPTGSVAQTVLSAATAQEQLHQSLLSEQMGEGQLGVGKTPWFSQSQPSSPKMLLGEDFLLPRNPCPSFPSQKPPASLRRKQGHNRPSSELGRSCVKTPKREPRVSTQPANSL